MSSWLEEYTEILDPQVGQVWHVVRKPDSGAGDHMMLLVEEKRRPNGKRWFWVCVDIETGVTSAIMPWERGPDWRWERFE